MRPSKARELERPLAPGAFLPGGSWNENAQIHHRGELDKLVRALVRERRFARLSPHEASQAIQASSHVLAFPHWRQWDTCTDWAMVWASTSAEEAVKRAGETVAGEHHWCGAGKWLPGKQSDCPEPLHRERMSQEAVRQLLDSLSGSLSNVPRTTQDGQTAPDVSPPPDEAWKGWEKAGGP